MSDKVTSPSTREYDAWVKGLPAAVFADVTVRLADVVAAKLLFPKKQPPRVKMLGDGVCEIKLEGKGPGYRVYYTHHRGSMVLLLGGNKTSQDRDIKDAKRLAKHIRAGRRHVEGVGNGPRRRGGRSRG